MKAVLTKRSFQQGSVVALVWLFALMDWLWLHLLPDSILTCIFCIISITCGIVLRTRFKQRASKTLQFWGMLSICVPVGWQAGVYFSEWLGLEVFRAYFARGGLALFFITGLSWVVWGIERHAQRIESARRDEFNLEKVLQRKNTKRPASDRRIWNPLDPFAWYYGQKSPRLNQSLNGFISYTVLFCLICMILSQFQGCTQYYDLPAGGGENQAVQQVVKVQKIIRKKFILNPYSAINYNTPDLDDVKLELNEVTAHRYTKMGFGEGEGAGFAGGTNDGMVGFVRLEYPGGDWNQDFGIGGDMNMLLKYAELTGQKIAKKTQAYSAAQLKTFDGVRCPPLLYITGQKNISLGNNDVKILQEYVNDKHGMIFGDNGGSRHFHNQFLSMMQRILPDVRPVRIPTDDPIHSRPYQITRVPYVAPHGGEEALGWFKDGRWVAYYHPGDIGDAWADGHAGVSQEIWSNCYRLGVNIMSYAHIEHAKWRLAQKQTGGEDE